MRAILAAAALVALVTAAGAREKIGEVRCSGLACALIMPPPGPIYDANLTDVTDPAGRRPRRR